MNLTRGPQDPPSVRKLSEAWIWVRCGSLGSMLNVSISSLKALFYDSNVNSLCRTQRSAATRSRHYHRIPFLLKTADGRSSPDSSSTPRLTLECVSNLKGKTHGGCRTNPIPMTKSPSPNLKIEDQCQHNLPYTLDSKHCISLVSAERLIE